MRQRLVNDAIQLQALVTLERKQVLAITLAGLYRVLGGERIENGSVYTDALMGLHSPTWMFVREANDIDRAVYAVIQHIKTIYPKEEPGA